MENLKLQTNEKKSEVHSAAKEKFLNNSLVKEAFDTFDNLCATIENDKTLEEVTEHFRELQVAESNLNLAIEGAKFDDEHADMLKKQVDKMTHDLESLVKGLDNVKVTESMSTFAVQHEKFQSEFEKFKAQENLETLDSIKAVFHEVTEAKNGVVSCVGQAKQLAPVREEGATKHKEGAQGEVQEEAVGHESQTAS